MNTSGGIANQVRTPQQAQQLQIDAFGGQRDEVGQAVAGSTPSGWRPTRNAGMGPDARTELRADRAAH